MKHLLWVAGLSLMLLTSCYTSKVYVGKVTPKEPLVEVASKMNHIFLFGLIPGKSTVLAVDKVADQKDYMIKNQWRFVDGFLSVITFGIYTPTITKFYVPLKQISKQ